MEGGSKVENRKEDDNNLRNQTQAVVNIDENAVGSRFAALNDEIPKLMRRIMVIMSHYAFEEGPSKIVEK